MTPKDVIAQAEKDFAEKFGEYLECAYEEIEDANLGEEIHKWCISYTKDLLQSVYKTVIHSESLSDAKLNLEDIIKQI